MNPHERKQEGRRERLRSAADRARRDAKAAERAADAIAGGIPAGQPVLVGHHSEKRHRRDLARMDSGLRRAMARRRDAEDLDRRADAVGTGGVSSDDPDAVAKLRIQVAEEEAELATRKRVNAAWRREGRPKPDDAAGWGRIESALRVEAGSLRTLRLDMARNPWHDAPYPPYAITNKVANVRRLRARIAELEAMVGRTDEVFHDGDGLRVWLDADENRCVIRFDRRQPRSVVALLRGWNHSRTFGAWVRKATPRASIDARHLVPRLLEAMEEARRSEHMRSRAGDLVIEPPEPSHG